MTSTPRTRLQQILQQEGRQQKWLSERTGIDKSLLSLYVNGHRKPQHPNRLLIAQALGRTEEIDELFGPPSVR